MLRPHGDDHNVALASFTVRGRSHARAAVAAVDHISEIADLAVPQVHFDVNEEQLTRDGAKDERPTPTIAIRDIGMMFADDIFVAKLCVRW
ncbi:hypothetical protein SPBR_05430 [Sporothrix brasiliensis 5110]|uniref:Uncharacterized protein n=1 Tax=Sporothrix brasiliensis 5110 TaxID=1398154 RepID=A0A0C2IEV6_9PEZI|nr:uncharacterized protein SPBR_05430 [Sporothrix brasiliensis 5110]KIH87761.1 hypothetical protein SPBR_05430 [Sporothrix brasiliensis 5110]